MAGKLKIIVSVNVHNLSLRDLLGVQSNLEFLSKKEAKYSDLSQKPNSRIISIQGGPEIYLLKYMVTDYDLDKLGFVIKLFCEQEYTHAQVRDMKSAAKRKSS